MLGAPMLLLLPQQGTVLSPRSPHFWGCNSRETNQRMGGRQAEANQ